MMVNKENNEWNQTDVKLLIARLARVEALLEKIAAQNKNIHVNIEHLEAKDTILENLDFHLDSLDIDELSGALNLGNNFGVRVEEKKNGSIAEHKKHRVNPDEVNKTSKSNHHGHGKKPDPPESPNETMHHQADKNRGPSPAERSSIRPVPSRGPQKPGTFLEKLQKEQTDSSGHAAQPIPKSAYLETDGHDEFTHTARGFSYRFHRNA